MHQIESLDALTPKYDVLFCDVWGVIHNGVEVFGPACAALERARANGLPVILLTNSPRPREGVIGQIQTLGVPDTAWDDVVTSGDVTRSLVAKGGRRVFHLGPERDLALYGGLEVDLVSAAQAEIAVCTGLVNDEAETPEDYDALLAELAARDIAFICANPDIKVERGERIVWCAGSLAERYADHGGTVSYAGKPSAYIYTAAMDIAARRLGKAVDRTRVLAIGDGAFTDILGAQNFGLDALFVSGGLHAREYDLDGRPDYGMRMAFLSQTGCRPSAIIEKLS